ncbi:hypothetical protein KOR42_50100 [Thalassoglobus neptunius]|uniref:Uncharacterized protein n=1 Tax=Thalassoglobus neptunius TaxID=1938619 RepID=A0A5C5VQ65_9PLAN|nr:hypothetical protein KOR42_50100 [Thalassoglobus neptunius]
MLKVNLLILRVGQILVVGLLIPDDFAVRIDDHPATCVKILILEFGEEMPGFVASHINLIGECPFATRQ